MPAQTKVQFPVTTINTLNGDLLDLTVEYHDNGKPEHSYFLASVLDIRRRGLYTAGCDTEAEAISAGFALVARIIAGQTE